MAFESISHSPIPSIHQPPATVIAKIARFEWEISRVEQEARAYQLLEGSELAPRFLDHVHEDGRIMGFVLEKVAGRPVSIDDLDVCEAALKKLHELGCLHGDANRYNFLITEEGVKLLDFERLEENGSLELMQKKLESLRGELTEESGRGGGFLFPGESKEE
jgi:predicted Ser/Thr protein kinase